MTIYGTLLARGYLPKELPPAFFSDQFSRYARTRKGREVLSKYKPPEKFTECVGYQLALPGSGRRLEIPHPSSFAELARLTSKHFRRLLKNAGRSPFSRSRPVYSTGGLRALRTSFKPSNLARERASVRGGGSYLVKADVNQFYPNLYTHAIGWAIDPQLRLAVDWHNNLLGKKIDQCVMNLQGKVSQGVPIGNDISFLLAEIVMGRVDRAIKVSTERSYRWFDDIEIACDTLEEAESVLARVRKELAKFRLRLNPQKSGIVPLPQPAQEEWKQILLAEGKRPLQRTDAMIPFFDTAFRLREKYPAAPVLLYALGLLFGIRRPEDQVSAIAQAGVTQTILCEPGAAQKGFALLTFWVMNGFSLDGPLLTRTIDQMIAKHSAAGVTSDVCWALAFCLEQGLRLNRHSAAVLSEGDDDCIAIQALHCNANGLMPKGFTTSKISRLLKGVDLNGNHWLLGYEAVRQGFLKGSLAAVRANPLFSDLLRHRVTFYRVQLPPYASVIHPGGAPEWVVTTWLDILQDRIKPFRRDWSPQAMPILQAIQHDLARLPTAERSRDDTVTDLLDVFEESAFPLIDVEPYG
jgi:hypothetical protein